MEDRFQRNIRYLRISLTERCNLRCLYCMPEEGVPKKSHEAILSLEEVEEIVAVAASCGISKIRLTGGEPLLRKGIVDFCRRIKQIPGITELCLTTNGLLLDKMAADLAAAGVDRLNLSLDTLDPERYHRITRIGRLEDFLSGFEAARRAGFKNIKLNTVLIGGFNLDEIPDLIELTKEEDLQLRFIELMPIGEGSVMPVDSFVSNEIVLERVPALQFLRQEAVTRVYQMPNYRGTVGLISPMSSCFCDQCDRLRLTADGYLKPCLHSESEISLRGLHGAELLETFVQVLRNKPEKHHLNQIGHSESPRRMHEIGG